MEFRDDMSGVSVYSDVVDIGTEWNLEFVVVYVMRGWGFVDIGTEWNLEWSAA